MESSHGGRQLVCGRRLSPARRDQVIAGHFISKRAPVQARVKPPPPDARVQTWVPVCVPPVALSVPVYLPRNSGVRREHGVA